MMFDYLVSLASCNVVYGNLFVKRLTLSSLGYLSSNVLTTTLIFHVILLIN